MSRNVMYCFTKCFTVSNYRYGFNSQERSNEINENSYTAEYWQYDSRIGRRWNIDPVLKLWESPYSCFEGNPIKYSDVNGDDWCQKGDEYKWFKGSGKQEGYTHIGSSHRYISVNKTIVTLSQNKEGTKGSFSEEAPKDDFEKAIINGKYYYTSNYGWVDKTHAFYESKRANIGANNLWANVNAGADGNSPDGYITYTQDADLKLFRNGITKYYNIDKGLDISKRREAAMAIMQDVSMEFEAKQALAFWSNSSFEISDLPSNVLGLYKTMFNLSIADVESLIKPLSKLQSIDVYRQNPGTHKMKNKSFTPVLFPNKYSPQTSEVPALFKSVKPANIGLGKDDFVHPSTGPSVDAGYQL
jgi:hypothetical protein